MVKGISLRLLGGCAIDAFTDYLGLLNFGGLAISTSFGSCFDNRNNAGTIGSDKKIMGRNIFSRRISQSVIDKCQQHSVDLHRIGTAHWLCTVVLV